MGDETMTRILRTYARRYRFAHPTSEDFIAVVNEVTGEDWRWYFDQTWFSSDLCDYAVDVRNDAGARRWQGFAEGRTGGRARSRRRATRRRTGTRARTSPR